MDYDGKVCLCLDCVFLNSSEKHPHEMFDEGITAGWTRASPLVFGNEHTNIRFGDVVGRPSDIYRLIFWNPEQRHLLTGNHRFVLFCQDYGAG